jgi:hypothetical protein
MLPMYRVGLFILNLKLSSAGKLSVFNDYLPLFRFNSLWVCVTNLKNHFINGFHLFLVETISITKHENITCIWAPQHGK